MSQTTHDRTVERLPWLVNGTLGAEERREVEEHLAACADCRRELAATRGAFDLHTAHLPPQVLTRYVEAPHEERWTVDGTPVERSVVERHLEHCDDCRQDLDDLRQGLTALEATEEDAEAGQAPDATVRPFRRPGATPPPPAAQPPRWQWAALAAALLVALVSAGGWWTTSQQADQRQAAVQELEERVAALRQEVDAAGTEGTAGDGETADAALQRQLAILKAELAEEQGRLADQRQQVARLEEQVADLSDARDAGPAIGDVRYVDLLYEGVVRGEDDETSVATLRGAPVVFRIALEGEARQWESVRYRVVDAAGAELARGELPVEPALDELSTSPTVSLFVSPAGLPEGELELQLLADGRVVRAFPFRR